MLTIDEARSRVAKGAAHLDTVRPGWWDAIDVGTLALSNPCGCIVGQLVPGTTFSNFTRQARRVFPVTTNGWPWGVDLDARDVDAGGMGLACAADFDRGFVLLQDAWIEAIADRRLRSGVRADGGFTNVVDACAPVPEVIKR
jgi:hypothetical protein